MTGLARLRTGFERVLEEARAMTLRELLGESLAVFRRHRLLIQSSAIAFRVLLTLIPLLLFAVALLGLLDLEEVWRNDVAPEVRGSLSHPAFTILDDAVTQVYQGHVAFWITVGALILLWEGSSVVRAAVRVLNAIYDVKESRSDPKRFGVSLATAAGVIALLLAAVALPQLAALVDPGGALGAVASALGWLLAMVALLVAVGLLVSAAPDIERPIYRVTFGALLVVVAWIVTSLLFWVYATKVASYADVFGHLATLFIALEYVYLSSTVLIAGLVVDSLVEGRRESRPAGSGQK